MPLSKYLKSYDARAKKLVAEGRSDKYIAKTFGVSSNTMVKWKKVHPSFAKAMTRKAHRVIESIPRGRYRAEYAAKAKILMRLGATLEDLAEFFEVSDRAIDDWVAKHPAFKKAVASTRQEADAKVVRSLYERATGYSHPDTHFAVSDGKVIQTPHTKHYPPDATSMIYWLNNRQPKLWRNKQEIAIENAEELTPWSGIKGGVDE